MTYTRRTMIGVICLGGSFTEFENTTRSFNRSLQDTNSGDKDEIKEQLPDYEGEPDSEEDYRERSDEISEALYNSLSEFEWLLRTSRTVEGGDWVISVIVTDAECAKGYVPEEWGGLEIGVEEGEPIDPE